MPGGYLQLTAYGPSNTYLNADPEITYWKQVWRRSTNFAMESIEMPFSGGAPNFGTKVTAPISKGADMAHRAWLEIQLPDLRDFYTSTLAATSSQPLIARAYVVTAKDASGNIVTGGSSVVIRVFKPAASPTSGSWAWYQVTYAINGVDHGYVTGSEPTHHTLFALSEGTDGYTEHSIPYADLAHVWTNPGDTVALTVTAVNDTFDENSTASMPRDILNIKWCNSVAHALLDTVEWDIGGTRMDYVPNPDFFDIWSELSEKEERRPGFNAMVGKYDDYDIWNDAKSSNAGKRYFVPLLFSFCQSTTSSVPILALLYHEMRINISFRNAQNLVKCNLPVTQLINTDPTTTPGQPISLANCQLYVDMVYLDEEERRRMSTMQHEQLITQIQYLGDYNVSPGDPSMIKKIPLDGFNHPIKEIIFVYQGWQRYQVDAVNGNDWFNYQLSDPTEDAFATVRLTLNGTERASPRTGQYFRQVQPYQHHTRIPTKHVLVYSFAIDPESKNPSGSCNFSRFEQASLNVTLSPNIDPNGAKIKVYGLGYNLIRYAEGLAGLAFPTG